MTIEASINSDAHNNIKEVSKVVDSDKLNLTRGLGVVYAASVVFFIFLLIHVTKRKKDLNKYENELKKILNTYDSMETKKDDTLKKGETTTPKKSKILFWGEYDEPGIYDVHHDILVLRAVAETADPSEDTLVVVEIYHVVEQDQ